MQETHTGPFLTLARYTNKKSRAYIESSSATNPGELLLELLDGGAVKDNLSKSSPLVELVVVKEAVDKT